VRGSAEQVRHQRRAGGAGELAVGGAGELAVGERSYMSHRRSMVSAGRESGTASKDAVVVSQRSAVEANSAGTCDALAATVRTGGDGGESVGESGDGHLGSCSAIYRATEPTASPLLCSKCQMHM
jgi:hypothetical protein